MRPSLDEIYSDNTSVSTSNRPSLEEIYAAAAKPDISKTESLARGALQGATLGTSDEIYGGIRSLTRDASRAIESKLYGDNSILSPISHKEARDASYEANKAAQEANPKSYLGGEVAGTIAGGGLGASTKAGATIANSLRSGNLGARAIKGGLAGAASGGLYGATTAAPGERIQGAELGAEYGGAIGAALPVVGAAASAAIGSAKNAIVNRGAQITADDIKTLSQNAYKTAAEKGGILKPEFTNQFINKLEQFKPQTEIGKIVGGDSPFTKIVEKIAGIKDKPISLEAAQELDELLGDAVDEFADKTTGKLTKQGRKLYDIQSQFRNMIENADQNMVEGTKEGFDALKEGRKLWSASRKLGDIERIVSRAESYDNPQAAIKTGFRTLANNPNRIKGYSPSEQALIKQAANSGVISDTLRTVLGSRLIPIITGASGGGLPATLASQATSMAARGAGTRIQLNKAANIGREITKNALPPELAKLPPREALKLIQQMRVSE